MHSRHDEGRNDLGYLACAGFQPTNDRDEPTINARRDLQSLLLGTTLTEPSAGLSSEINSDQGDLLARGFWDKGTDCIVDIRVFDVHQPSHLARKRENIIKLAEIEKERKYVNPCLEQRYHLTSFVVSCEGLLGKEASTFLQGLSKRLSDKWNLPYYTTISFVRARFSIALVRAKNRFIRGSRILSSYVSQEINWEDGTGLCLFSTLEQATTRTMTLSYVCFIDYLLFNFFVPFIQSNTFNFKQFPTRFILILSNLQLCR